MQLVEIVEIHVRFHLSQDKTNQFIVTTASKTINQKEATGEEADLAETAVVEKPVYCNDCFQDKKPARDDRGRY